MPPDEQKLTDKQFSLLADVLIRSNRDGEIVPVVWSPKKFLSRSPTRGESSAMSTRLKTLIDRGFIKRYGRELLVTELGQRELWVSAMDRAQMGDMLARAVLFFTEMLKARKEKEAFATAGSALIGERIPIEKKTEIIQILISAASNAEGREIKAKEFLGKVIQEYVVERNKEL